MEKDVRKLTVTGNGGTYYVTLPKTMVKNLKWRKGQKVVITQEGDVIKIEDWKDQKREVDNGQKDK